MTVGRWADHAACKGKTPLFFPAQGDSVSYQAAVKICGTCPVLEECRAHGLEEAERFGIWGGLSAKTRTEVRNPREPGVLRYRCGTYRAYNDGCRCDTCRDFYNAGQRVIRARNRKLRAGVAPGAHTSTTPNK
jgi:WhiB family redox-sensing transcriptional regulator